VVAAQCRRFDVDSLPVESATESPAESAESPAELAAELWDLARWAERARALLEALDALVGTLDAGDVSALAPGFVLSAAALRHFQADPLLPDELLPVDWPGDELRHHYDRYDRAYRGLLAQWFAAAP
jgi:phenylacetic acid degradation operon negative regulatory protein